MPLINDTRQSDDWIKQAITDNPCVLLEDGQVRTCPVRLSFPYIFERQEPMEPGKQGSYGASLLFPIGANLQPLFDVAAAAARNKWPSFGTTEGPKLHNPFLPQNDSLKYGGFIEGGTYIRAVAYKNRPPVFNKRNQLVLDESQVYPGVWAICVINAFPYEHKVNKGVSFGLNGLVLYEDDENLGGGGIDPNTAFAGLKFDASTSPSGLFGGSGGGGNPFGS